MSFARAWTDVASSTGVSRAGTTTATRSVPRVAGGEASGIDLS